MHALEHLWYRLDLLSDPTSFLCRVHDFFGGQLLCLVGMLLCLIVLLIWAERQANERMAARAAEIDKMFDVNYHHNRRNKIIAKVRVIRTLDDMRHELYSRR